jgi:hypothetical protein
VAKFSGISIGQVVTVKGVAAGQRLPADKNRCACNSGLSSPKAIFIIDFPAQKYSRTAA